MFFSVKKKAVPDEQAIRDVMLLLDEWKSPEPSPWFDARMHARFREEQTREPEGFLARVRDRMLFNNRAALRPMMAGAMALLLVAGGGSYWQAAHIPTASRVGVSAAVQDLQILDNYAQAIQQMDQLLDDNNDNDPPQS